MLNLVKSEEAAKYTADIVMAHQCNDDQTIVDRAIAILDSRIKSHETTITSPADTINYLRLKLSHFEHEVFCCIFLDNRHRVICFEEMFRGTIDGASVHPREIVKQALAHNAAAVILAHNHPSGTTAPSRADAQITQRIKAALALVDIRVLDHLIIGDGPALSLAEHGLV